jgi:mono/diheme cytochrome c family protein
MKKKMMSGAFLAMSMMGWSQDVVALYKSKCQSCHGANGAGRPSMKGSNLLTDETKKASDAQLIAAILEGGPAKKSAHAYEKKGVSAEQAKALTAHIRTLQK